jgi:menaquinol-cytochrome c reductase iron-sulfur subunit
MSYDPIIFCSKIRTWSCVHVYGIIPVLFGEKFGLNIAETQEEVSMPGSQHELSRNGFVKVVTAMVGTAMGVIIGIPAIGYLISPATKTQKSDSWIPLGPLENIPLDVPTLFNFTRSVINGWEKTVNSYGVYVWRKNEDEVKVLSNVCTHLSCRVKWDEGKKGYLCPCHAAVFDIEGNVQDGPPPRPLKMYSESEGSLKIEQGTLFIHFVEG